MRIKRRSFFGLLSGAITALLARPLSMPSSETRFVIASEELLRDSAIDVRQLLLGAMTPNEAREYFSLEDQ